jgi:hypothetical protein
MEREASPPRTPETLAGALIPIERRLRLLAAREADRASPIHDVPLPLMPTDDEGIDRTILLLAAAVTLAPRRWDDLLSQTSRWGLTPAAIADLFEADTSDLDLRLRVLGRFDRGASLIADGLVRVEGWGEADEPRSALVLGEIRLTDIGLRAVLDPKFIPRPSDEDRR